MQSPKKGLVCNLNHVHLQHISLGLHLSRHPELQEEAHTLIPPRKGTGCQDCREHNSSGGPVLVDANSNNPSLVCQCCDGHPLHLDVKQDLQSLQILPNCPVLNHEEEEEEVGSPSDPASSSASSCSDLSLDDTPVSVCCRGFPVEEAQSPENQPNIVPLEDAHNVPPLASPEERGLNLNIQADEHPTAHVWGSPDSLGSSSSLESASDAVSPCSQTPVESPVTGSSSPTLHVPPPVRPCRAPPAVPVRHMGPELDSNCNALPPQDPKSLSLEQVDINSNQAGPPRPRFVGAPPPVPPRTKQGLQGLRRGELGKASSEGSSELPFRQGDPRGEGTKHVTSFHELAQKRKKVANVAPPPQTRKDQSDWLIVFSPDTELPPCHEITWGGVPNQETVGPQAVPPEPVNTANGLQRGVTTFKELRYRKQNGHLPPQVGTQAPHQVEPGQAMPESSIPPQEIDPKGHFQGPKEIPPRKKKSRPGLQPIMEGGFEEGEDGGAENKASDRSLEGMPNGRRDPWMPGKEERGDRCFMEVRHSQSLGGISSTGHLLRTDTDRLSAELREQKKALLVAVSASVDKIVAHFSTARNLVQKAQLGDSRLSPDVGYLVLSTLCPALRALVGDGLKPFQKDVITGQRPSSPWSVVEASAKPGPHTRSLNALYWRVSRLAPLGNNQQRFHAFILGLLNMKQLEQWFAHLQQNSDLLLALYWPTAFLVLSQGFCRCWAEELLLLLQPLSMLTFQLDLLFEHHHLPLNVRPVPRHTITPTEPPTSSMKASGLRGPDLLRHPVPTSEQAEGPLAQSSPIHESRVRVPLHQRLLQWGDRLTHTLQGNEASAKPKLCPQTVQQEMEEKQQSWWEQLSWASGVYANSTSSSISKHEGFPHTQWTKLRMAVGEAIKEARTSMALAAESSNTDLQTPSSGESGSEPQVPATEVGNSPEGEAAKKPEMTAASARESLLAKVQEASDNPDALDTPGSGKGKWLGWLFGANYPGTPTEPDLSLSKSSRRPSSWLPPTMNVLALVMKTAPAEKSSQKEPWEGVSPDPLQTHRTVRALCDHVGSGDSQLSFHKGDVLQILDTVDEDWLQCCHGERKGLVPVGYTSLIL